MNLLRTIKSGILRLASVACCATGFAQPAGHANPLLNMVGREPCGVYYAEYEALCDSLFSGDSLARVQLIRLFSEAAAADPSGAWELDRRRIEGHIRFYESRKGGYTPSEAYTTEAFARDLLDIARTAEERGLRNIRLQTLANIAAIYRIFAHDYELAFSYYLEVADEAMKLPLREFPWKFYVFLEIADFYFSFREYEDAARFYRLIAEDREMTSDNERLCPALNGLGLCYRYAEQYDKSDSCFSRILDVSAPVAAIHAMWVGIAEGNIGYNYYLRGDYDRALAWMIPALAKMNRPEDDPFTSRLAVKIATIHLDRNALRSAKKYLDTALEYHRRSRLPEKDSHLLEVEARYHALRGDRREAAAGLEATLRAKEREQEAFSGLVLRRVEQQLRAADRKVHEERLGAEKMRSRIYRETAIVVSAALIAILLLLILVSIFYRRTRKAYRELVRRSQQWAGVEPGRPEENAAAREEADSAEAPELSDADNEEKAADAAEQSEPEAFDRTIMHAVETAVIERKMFKQADLTLDMLAAATGYSRYYLSAALNRCTGANFNSYVNEQRIKEAVRVMSDPANADLTVDAVAFDAGFNDRKNFYRVFKKVTGLSPTQFRRNIVA